MKTTVVLSDQLLAEAKRVAARDHTSLRALIEDGLRLVLQQRQRTAGFKLRDATFRGRGLQRVFRDAGWDRIRAAALRSSGR